MFPLEAIIFLCVMLANVNKNEAVIQHSMTSRDAFLDRWRDNWTYTISKMDSQSAHFYLHHNCQIADKRHIREHIDDAFSTWVNVFVRCSGIELGVISLGVCDPFCRNGLRACEVIRLMENVPIFRVENIKDRQGRSHMIQVPVACKCKLRTLDNQHCGQH